MGRINEPTAWHRAVVVLRFTSHKDGTADSECIAREILPPPPNQVLERSDSLWATGFVVQLPPSPTFLVRECWSATTTLHSQKARADRNRRCSLLKPSWNFARQNVQSISSTDDQAADIKFRPRCRKTSHKWSRFAIQIQYPNLLHKKTIRKPIAFGKLRFLLARAHDPADVTTRVKQQATQMRSIGYPCARFVKRCAACKCVTIVYPRLSSIARAFLENTVVADNCGE